MNIIYLISIILGVSFQNVVKKPYTQKTSGKGLYFFCLLVSISAMLFFIFTSANIKFSEDLLVYAVFFALSYITATVCNLYAVSCGPVSLTSLILSYSLIIPTVYGFVFLKDPINPRMVFGLILLVISLFLINKKDKESNLTAKWLMFSMLAFVGNGMSSVIQKMQQKAFDGAFKNEFMILSLAIVTAAIAVFVAVNERQNIKTYAKAGWHLAILCGIANGIVNLFVMILSGIMPVSVMFPMISAGGIIVTYLVSRFFYNEILTKAQFIGFIIGIASVIFLS